MADQVYEGESIGISDSATGRLLCVLSEVDITKECPKITGSRMLLQYTRAQRALLCQINGDGSRIWFTVEKLDDEMKAAPKVDMFGSTAERLGIDKAQLRSLIEQHAPAA